eukprot:5733808-Lingulodinium_polyedra.AAC.1
MQTLVTSWLGVAVGPVESWKTSVVPPKTHCALGTVKPLLENDGLALIIIDRLGPSVVPDTTS